MLVVGLAVSIAAWRVTEQRIGGEAARQFLLETARAAEAIDRRIQDNFNILIGLKGLFNASDRDSREEFHVYLSGFNLERHYSGVRVVTYIQRVTRAQKAAFEREVRRDISIDPRGYPDFAIKPPGERDEYVVRSADADDRRRVLVDVTPAAQAVLDQVLPEIQQVSRRIFDGMGAQRQQALLDVLDDIRQAIAELPADLAAPEPRRRPDRLTR